VPLQILMLDASVGVDAINSGDKAREYDEDMDEGWDEMNRSATASAAK
jgi:hypothetical protein